MKPSSLTNRNRQRTGREVNIRRLGKHVTLIVVIVTLLSFSVWKQEQLLLRFSGIDIIQNVYVSSRVTSAVTNYNDEQSITTPALTPAPATTTGLFEDHNVKEESNSSFVTSLWEESELSKSSTTDATTTGTEIESGIQSPKPTLYPTLQPVVLIEQPPVKPPRTSKKPKPSPTPHPVATTEPLLQPPPRERIHRNITVLVPLVGELGNHLSMFANARITQLIAQEKYPHIHINIVGQHSNSDHGKWQRTRDELVTCFPSAFRDMEFEGGYYDESGEFQAVEATQNSWLSEEERRQLFNVRSFEYLDSLLLQQEQNLPGVPQSPVSNYSLPYLIATAFNGHDLIDNEHYYEEMRQWMTFNNECCSSNVYPGQNDTVFHFRNFEYELRDNKFPYLKGFFHEIPPDVAADVAFMDDASDQDQNIAITSRFEPGTEKYIDAFRKRGISSNYVDGQQNGIEAFCYIMQAQKETFGAMQSTFYIWATILGNATSNRFYFMNIPPENNSTGNSNDTAATKSPIEHIGKFHSFNHGNRTFSLEQYTQP